MPSIKIGQLKIQMERHAEALTKNLNVLTRNTVRAIINRLAIATPVDTGEAVSNWHVTLNGPSADRIPPYYPGQMGSTKSQNARAMLEANRAVIKQFYSVNGDTLFLSNAVPYIGKLNQGSSTQAPAGFVEAAIMDGAAHVRSAAPIISGTFTDVSE